jgi:hypothetical protein
MISWLQVSVLLLISEFYVSLSIGKGDKIIVWVMKNLLLVFNFVETFKYNDVIEVHCLMAGM